LLNRKRRAAQFGEARMNRDRGVMGSANQLLDALPADEYQRLLPRLRAVFVEIKTVLFEAGAPVAHVDFPRNCVVSLVTPLHDGAVVEVATVGNEGIVGVPLVRGGALTFRAVCSVAGWCDRMDAPTFLSEVERDGPFSALVADYMQALFGQISQAAACNRLHSNEERLSRWLLMSQDRVRTDEFAITHEYLAHMLGSRRPTVSRSAGILQAAGLIRYHRGRVTIVDRAALETTACECYAAIARKLDGVVQRAFRRSSSGTGPPS
jgi:CRP-like cAMP-binding protein